MLPRALHDALTRQFGAVRDSARMHGGDINSAARFAGADGTLHFVKWNPRLGAEVFEAEAAGLHALRKAGGLRVPEVRSAGQCDSTGYLVLEWIEPSVRKDWHALGEGLAALHRNTAPQYGFATDNWIGRLPQENRWTDEWPKFWAERRIAPLVRRAVDAALLDEPTVRRFDRLCSSIAEAIGRESLIPSLLHGDLWRGNVLFTGNGEPAVIDPAVYFGDREVEIAFTELFGAFDSEFLRAYEGAFPLSEAYSLRKSAWQLYPLLVHLNLFGAGYRGSVVSALTAAERLLR